MDMNMINYSIIIPHKNIPDLLQRCLNSIPRRTDIQIIVVDDNSDPKKVDFEHFPGVGEKCVEVYFTKEGKGAGYARNMGLKYAKGKWLLFADADDYFVDDLLPFFDEYVYSVLDIVFFDVESRDNITNELTNESRNISEALHICDFKEKTSLVNLVFNNEVPWGKIIKNNLVKQYGILFDEVLASNDTMFMLKSLYYATAIGFFDKILYCWSTRQNSLVHSLSKDIIMSRYEVCLRRNCFCIDKGYKIYSRSIANWLLQIANFGIISLYEAFVLCYKYRINPFIKCQNWLRYIRAYMCI